MGRKNNRNQWKEEIDVLFDTEDIDTIIDRSGYWFQKIKNGTDNEEEKIRYWLELAYEHEETNENPFFPVLLMYAICLNENVSANKLESAYMKYAVLYVNETNRGAESWLDEEKNNLSEEQRAAADLFLKISASVKSAKTGKSFGKKHLAAGFAAGLLAGLLIGSLCTAAVQKIWSDKAGTAVEQEQTGNLPDAEGDKTGSQNTGETGESAPSAEESSPAENSSDKGGQDESAPGESSSDRSGQGESAPEESGSDKSEQGESTPAESSDTGVTNQPLGENGDENTAVDNRGNPGDIIAGAKVRVWTNDARKAVNLRSTAEAGSSNIIAKVNDSSGLILEAGEERIEDQDGNIWREVRFLNDLAENEQNGIQILTDTGIKKGDTCYVAEQYLQLAEE